MVQKARSVKQEATESEAYLGGEVGHWSIVAKMNETAAHADLQTLCDWALPIQQRHLQEVLDGSLKLAADEDPNEETS